jgi:hypothetical protein
MPSAKFFDRVDGKATQATAAADDEEIKKVIFEWKSE